MFVERRRSRRSDLGSGLPDASRLILWGGTAFRAPLLGIGEDSEPDGEVVFEGPVDAVAAVGGEEDGIAGGEDEWFIAAFDGELGLALEEEDPFVLVLVVPIAFRGSMAMGDDAFDADRVIAELTNGIGVLGGEVLGDVAEEVDEGEGFGMSEFGHG